MDRATDLIAEHAIDELVLLNAAASRKRWRYDRRAEVVAAAGVILDFGSRAGDGVFDALLDFLCSGHLD
jgi:hypothetical protein